MNIQDILRGLPFPMQGALMSMFGAQGQSGNGARQPIGAVQDDGSYDAMGNYTGMGSGILSQPAPAAPAPNRPRQFPKDEAGFESLITRVMANDSGAPSQVSALPVTEVPNLPPVAAATAQQYAGPSAASMAPDNRDVGGGQNFAMQGPTPIQAASGQGNGILGYLDKAVGYSQPDFLSRFGTALAVAGSQDPTKALMMVQQNRAEEAKIAEAVRKANQPKFTPLKDGAFTQVEIPGQLPFNLPNADVQKFIKETTEAKSGADLQRQLLVAKAGLDNKNQFATFQGLNEAAGGSGASAAYKPEVQTQIGYAKAAIDFLKNGGDNVNLGIAEINSPMARDLFDRTLGKAFGSDAAAARRQMDFLLGAEVLSDVGQMKGALSDADREYLKSIRPKSDDPTALKINYLTELQTRIDRREQSRVEAATKRDAMLSSGVAPAATGAAPTATQAPAAANGVARPSSKAQYDALPSGAKYIAPNGMELTKK